MDIFKGTLSAWQCPGYQDVVSQPTGLKFNKEERHIIILT